MTMLVLHSSLTIWILCSCYLLYFCHYNSIASSCPAETCGSPLVSSVKRFLDEIKDETLGKDEKRKLISELSKEKVFRIMACGMTGHGKSTLLNGIVGRPIFKPGHGTASETSGVNEYSEFYEHSSIVVLDTPGFMDTEGKEREYLQEIRAKCKKVDTLLYCVSMMECRITEDTKKQLSSTISKLKKVLKNEIWKNCVIALTFANITLSRISDELDDDSTRIKEEFSSILDSWKLEIQIVLCKAGIENFKDVPIIPVGKAKEPKLFRDDEKTWLSTLWNTIYAKSPSNGRAVLFHFNAHRLYDGDISADECEFTQSSIHQQKIEIDQTFKEKLWETIKRKHPTIAAAFAVGGTGGVAGATIGATIGALAIGIPSFGIAAGVGLLLGGLIGGGIGVGVGVAAGTGIERFQQKKREKGSTSDEKKAAEPEKSEPKRESSPVVETSTLGKKEITETDEEGQEDGKEDKK